MMGLNLRRVVRRIFARARREETSNQGWGHICHAQHGAWVFLWEKECPRCGKRYGKPDSVLLSFISPQGQSFSEFSFGASPCVYLVRAEGKYMTAYKIGWTARFNERIQAIKAGNPFITQIWTLGPLSKSKCTSLEKRLHSAFSAKRIRGEWFQLMEEDIEALEAVGFCRGD